MKFFLLTAVLLWPAVASATIDQPSEIPASTSAQSDLGSRRSVLMTQWNALQQKISAHNAKCGHIPEDSPMVEECSNNQAALSAELQAYNDAVTEFDHEIAFVRGLDDTHRGVPLNASRTNDEAHRSAFNYAKVIDQFQVEKSARYRPEKKTYCNIFVWDVTRAMGAEIPHYVFKSGKTGDSAVDESGDFKAGSDEREELNVNATVDWLKEHGPGHGWRRVDARGAQEMASGGHPAVAIWANPDREKSGHIAMIRPGSSPVGARGAAIAQAGRLVLDAAHLDASFRKPTVRKSVQYWYHE